MGISLVALLISIMTLVASMPNNQLSSNDTDEKLNHIHLDVTQSSKLDPKNRTISPEDKYVLDQIFNYTSNSPTTKPEPTPDPVSIMNPCGKGLTYCEDIEGYDDLIDELLKKSEASIGTLTLVDELVEDPIDIGDRYSPTEIVPFCSSNKRKIQPRAAYSKNNKWEYVLNNRQFNQQITVEVCANEGQKCEYTISIPTVYRTICKQEYIYRTLLTINNDSGEQNFEQFKIPSCCKCAVEYDGYRQAESPSE